MPGDQPVGVDHLRRQRLLAREGQQALVRLAARLAASQRGFHVCADIDLAARQLALHQVHGADDDRQHVVEVMRDAAGQLADRLHLLHLADLRLGRLARGDLLPEAGIGFRSFVCAEMRSSSRLRALVTPNIAIANTAIKTKVEAIRMRSSVVSASVSRCCSTAFSSRTVYRRRSRGCGPWRSYLGRCERD